jgi:hypothetical protein
MKIIIAKDNEQQPFEKMMVEMNCLYVYFSFSSHMPAGCNTISHYWSAMLAMNEIESSKSTIHDKTGFDLMISSQIRP